MQVKDSPLYKALCKDVRAQDHAELLRMLELASQAPHANWSPDATTLSCAFVWHDTPQGFDYWCELERRIKLRHS